MNFNIKVPKPADDEHSSSAQIVVDVDELLTEILLRLPVKSLVRFRTVSKKWDSLITNPRFCQLRNAPPNPPSGLFFFCSPRGVTPWYEYVPYSVKESTRPTFRRLKLTEHDNSSFRVMWSSVMQSCNGLFLCRTSKAGWPFCVDNPTTTKFSRLPMLDPGVMAGISLAFDPAKSPYYKVVYVRFSKACQSHFEVQDYSSETSSSWKHCGKPFTTTVDFKKGIYWNGSIHWINKQTTEALYFIPDEHLIPLKMPVLPVKNWSGHNYFGESCDHLHYIDTCQSSIIYDVYEMKRDYSEWFLNCELIFHLFSLNIHPRSPGVS